MKKTDLSYLTKHAVCSEGLRWARTQPSLKVAWERCERPEWMFWILDKKAPLTQGISVRIAIACAERSLVEFEKQYPNDKRPREAIAAAWKWADNPTEENRLAASAAADAAFSAAFSAYAAAYAAYAAAYAANAAANAAEKQWQCDLIRSLVPNPFTKEQAK